jgi:hypothetical protein
MSRHPTFYLVVAIALTFLVVGFLAGSHVRRPVLLEIGPHFLAASAIDS